MSYIYRIYTVYILYRVVAVHIAGIAIYSHSRSSIYIVAAAVAAAIVVVRAVAVYSLQNSVL